MMTTVRSLCLSFAELSNPANAAYLPAFHKTEAHGVRLTRLKALALLWVASLCLPADDPESFGSSATAEGFTAVSSTDTGSGTSTTSGTANTAAGEKALRTLPRDDIFLDGASGLANIVQRAIGEHLPVS